ncbi:Oligopeptide transport ATP-binding protein OppD [Chlamydiales bacterium SCGC AB-751-O23]|jgi:oligopeptide transport system ATP-binding protein|nr:Oligopeptide transport ATP-binding protein OppD [Chlamydiales bacterium SCGC AB-751-O23]
MKEQEILLKIEDLHVRFETLAGQIHAVRGVDLNIAKGEGLAIVGESGCGKSVTAQSIVSLIPQPPGEITKGNIYFNGEDLLKKTEKDLQKIRGKNIAMIFQNPMTALNPVMKIGKQITEVMAKHLSLDKKEAKRRAIELLSLVGISQAEVRFNEYPHQFSGGMRQRVMIAIALVCRPELVIADEPTTALDVTIQAQILTLIAKLKKQFNMSLLLITHDLSIISEVCERVVVMYAGKIVEEGKIDEVLENPQHPYTRGLLRSLPSGNKEHELNPIEGSPPDLYRPSKGCAFAPRCSYAMKICEQKQPEVYPLKEGATSACFLQHPQALDQKLMYAKD